MDIRFTEGQESFGVGGPWLGNCFLNNRRLKKQFLEGNFIFTPDKKYIALNRCSDISAWAKDREFKIVVADIENHRYFISRKGVRSLFLESMDEDRIVFYQAFHDKIADFKRTIDFSRDTFDEIKESDMFE